MYVAKWMKLKLWLRKRDSGLVCQSDDYSSYKKAWMLASCFSVCLRQMYENIKANRGEFILSDLEVQHVQAPASDTGPGLTSVTSDLRPSIGKCVSLRGKEARHQEDLFGTETQISLGGRGVNEVTAMSLQTTATCWAFDLGGKHAAAPSTRCKFLHCYRTLMQPKLWMSKWVRHTLKRGKPPVSRRPSLRFRPTFSEPVQDFPSL